MKKTKNGRDFYDLQIVRSGYEENVTKDDEENDGEEVEVVWEEKCAPDDECQMNGNTCYGFCQVCKGHQPLNGGQCKCVLK